MSTVDKVIPPEVPRIIVPADFDGKHRIEQTDGYSNLSGGVLRRKKAEGGVALVAARADILENKPVGAADGTEHGSRSIFNLLKEDDRQRIKSIAQGFRKEPEAPPPALEEKGTNEPEQPAADFTGGAGRERPMLTPAALLNSTFAGLSQAFRNRFVSSTGSFQDGIVKEGMATAAEYTAKVSETIASSAKATEKDKEKEQKTAANKAPTAKKFQVVRTSAIWAPAPLLCKRFNIKAPDISKEFAAASSGLLALCFYCTSLMWGWRSRQAGGGGGHVRPVVLRFGAARRQGRSGQGSAERTRRTGRGP